MHLKRKVDDMKSDVKRKYFRDVKDHPDFFIVDINDLSIKDEMLTMEHPFFSLSNKKDTKVREWDLPNGGKLKVTPTEEYGLATIHDKDVWIYFLSLAVREFNETKKVPERVYFNSYDCLKTIKRTTGGLAYKRLKNTLERLSSTHIASDVGNKSGKFNYYPLINECQAITKDRTGSTVAGYVDLPAWVRRNIEKRGIKQINPDYFLLKRPIDKRLYQIASKHVGNGTSWSFKLDKLKEKCGSSSSKKEFKRMIKESIKNELFPDYIIELDPKNDTVKFINRNPTKVEKRSHTNKNDIPIVSELAKGKVKKLAKKSDNTHLNNFDDVSFATYKKWVEFWKLTGRKKIIDVDKEYLIFSANFIKEYDGF